MSRSTISTFELFALIPDQESARAHLEARLWPRGAICPVCGLGERITVRKGGFYRCNRCREDFTVRTGTIFERSHVPLHKWVAAMYLLVTARISSMQLAMEIGITQKSAWFVLHRLRDACGPDLDKLRGIIEIDETKNDRPEVPPVLDAIADVVLRYRPKDKGQSAKKKRERGGPHGLAGRFAFGTTRKRAVSGV